MTASTFNFTELPGYPQALKDFSRTSSKGRIGPADAFSHQGGIAVPRSWQAVVFKVSQNFYWGRSSFKEYNKMQYDSFVLE